MDSSITAAGRALRAGDPLGALKRVALRDDPAALALRGIAMAQLGDLGRARGLLRRAARGFGPRGGLAGARRLAAGGEAAARSGIGALCAEVEQAGRTLVLPAARLVAAGEARSLTLAEVEGVLASPDLVVDGCRRAVRRGARVVRLSRRPALFELLYG